jgi:hypothetical protein
VGGRKADLPDPQTTKINSARSQGPTGDVSSWAFCKRKKSKNGGELEVAGG